MYHFRSKNGGSFQTGLVKIIFREPTSPSPEFPISSPQAGGEGSASISMQEVYGEAFEGVPIWHGSPHGVLELLVAAGGASAALQLIGWQRRGQQVAEVVVPHSGQLQVLQERATTFSSGRTENDGSQRGKALEYPTTQNKKKFNSKFNTCKKFTSY